MSSGVNSDNLDAAFGLVEASCDWSIRRFDAAEDRIQHFMSFVATITVAVPLLAASLAPSPELDSVWLLLALLTFTLTAALMVGSRFVEKTGYIDLIDLKEVHDDYIQKDEEKFKKELLETAGKKLRENIDTVSNQTTVVAVMAGLFALEVVFLSLWVIGA